MSGIGEGSAQAKRWYVRAVQASRDAANWVTTAPDLSNVRLRDAAWLLERYRHELRLEAGDRERFNRRAAR